MDDLARLSTNRRGAAAIEFAIVAPVLISLLLGGVDLVPALLAKLKAGRATSSAVDLVTQAPLLQASDLTDIYAGAGDVLAPFSSASFAMRLTSVFSDGNGNAFVHWSCGQGALPAYAAKAAVTTTPTGDSVDTILNRSAVTFNGARYSTANTSYVVAETRYGYTAPAQFVLRSAVTLVNTAFSLPRRSSYVGFPWSGIGGDTTTPPASASSTGTVTIGNGAVCNYAS